MPDDSKVEITAVLLARSLQGIRSRSGSTGYLPDVVQEIKNRYLFLIAPREDEIFVTPPKGVEFKHGKFMYQKQSVVIDQLTVFNDGVAADTSSSTDDSDHFLDNLAEWAKVAMPKAEITGPRYYLSHLEVKMSEPLEVYTPRFQPIGEKVTMLLNGYGIPAPRYEATAINLHFDQLGKAGTQPGVFYIDRRLGLPFNENLWFSQAPLRTTDHIALLKELGR
jgi:hypothetical protein